MVTHESTRTFTPSHPGRNPNASVTFSRNVSAKVSFEPNFPFRVRRLSRTLPPTFLFLLSSVVKEQTSQNTMSKARPLPPQGPTEVAHAALLKSLNKGELLGRQRRPALVGEAYIGGTPPNCQQRFRHFARNYRLSRTAISAAAASSSHCAASCWI